MTYIHAIMLGIVEGLTEFLPVSSTGHLILASRLLGLPQTEFMKTFEISIQVGAILAVVLIYWRRLLTDIETLKRVLAAFIPTAIVGLLLYKLIKKYLFAGTGVVLWSLFIGGIVLIVFDKWYGSKERTASDVSLPKAAGIGLFQSLAVVPGVSRAGATILGGLALGIDRRTIVEFSFLLAVPTLAAATALDLAKNASSFDASQWQLLLAGGAVSFVTAIAGIRFFLRFIEKHGFTAFGVYRIALALFFWVFVR